jgi:hypothetical protein
MHADPPYHLQRDGEMQVLTTEAQRHVLTLPCMREMSVAEQKYKAVLAVIGDGRTVSEVATDRGLSPTSRSTATPEGY